MDHAVNDRVIPFSSDAEASVLGALMLDNMAFDAVCEHVSAEDFYHQANKYIYDAIEQLAAENSDFDVLTLCDRLDTKGHLADAGGMDYLSNLIDCTPTCPHARP